MTSKFIAKGGILTSLGLIFIYLSTIIPTNKLFLLSITSCLIIISILITDKKTSFIVYLSTSLLSFLLFGLKGTIILYFTFFGIYSFVKYKIEKLNKLYLEIILKLIFFNLCVFVNFIIYKYLFLPLPNLRIPAIYLVFLLQIIFLIYDYVITLFVTYFSRHFISKI